MFIINCSFEILHARWAMLAALGALVPEMLDLLGAFHFVEPVWWRVGYSKLKVSILFSWYQPSSRGLLSIFSGSLDFHYLPAVHHVNYEVENCSKKPVPDFVHFSHPKSDYISGLGFYTIYSMQMNTISWIWS